MLPQSSQQSWLKLHRDSSPAFTLLNTRLLNVTAFVWIQITSRSSLNSQKNWVMTRMKSSLSVWILEGVLLILHEAVSDLVACTHSVIACAQDQGAHILQASSAIGQTIPTRPATIHGDVIVLHLVLVVVAVIRSFLLKVWDDCCDGLVYGGSVGCLLCVASPENKRAIVGVRWSRGHGEDRNRGYENRHRQVRYLRHPRQTCTTSTKLHMSVAES